MPGREGETRRERGRRAWIFGRREPTAVVPDAVEILRRILQPCDGAERPMVELLAEEEGIAWKSVRGVIDRLVCLGRIRSERGPDDVERLTWIGPPSGGAR